MKRNLSRKKRCWLMMTLLFACLFGGSSGLWASVSFEPNCYIEHQPTLSEPYIGVRMVFYDADGNDSYFTHQGEDTWVWSSAANTYKKYDGPAVYVDEHFVGAPDSELAWPGGDNTGNGTGAKNYCDNDSWVGNTYSNTFDGITYQLKFRDPWKINSDRYAIHMRVYISRMAVGSTHKVRIHGFWKINNVKTYEINHSMTTDAVPSPWDGETLVATMTDYNHVSVSGSLNKNYGSTTVGILQADEGSVSKNKGYVAAGSLASKQPFDKGQTKFSGLTHTHNRSINQQANGSTVALEYIVGVSADDFSTTLYEWFNVNVPGFVKPYNVGVDEKMWDKALDVKWSADEADSRSKEGTWSVYRDGELLANNLSYDNQHYLDDKVNYDTNYEYMVKFVPKNTPEGVDVNSLTASVKQMVLKRKWTISSFDISLIDDDSHISLSWVHDPIKDASGTNTYKLTLYRSDDGGQWESIKEFSINSSSTATGSYVDNSGLVSEHSYKYMLVVNVLGKDYSKESTSVKLGGSKLTGFTATRGTYSNMVQLTWTVKQVGEKETKFVVFRRPFGFIQEKEWTKIYSTSGTGTTYSYDDNKALPGTYNEYMVSIMGVDSNHNEIVSTSLTTDGFTYSSGVVSGRITYGTGTAVDSVKVVLKQQNGDGDITAAGMNSLQFVSEETLFQYKTDTTEIHNLYRGDFSVQMWVRPDYSKMSTTNTNYFLFDTYNILSIYLKCKGDSTYEVIPWLDGYRNSGIHIPADKWSHITVSYSRGNSLLRTVVTLPDGTTKTVTKEKVVSPWTEKALSATDFRLGVGTNGYFGYLDEFRFFTKALTDGEIERNYNHPLSGSEEGLAIYYPFDEGLEMQTIAYDYSKTNGIANGRHAISKVTAYSSQIIPNENQLCLMNYTDTLGNYTVRGIPFVGEGTAYSIIPSKGIHEFSPSAKTCFISAQSLVHSGIDFEDISSFPVSGQILYAGTDYPVEGVSLYVDGIVCSKNGDVIQTNKEGKFTISVPIGDHFITVAKNGHVFANNGRYPADPNATGLRKTFNKAIPDLEFTDETLVNFSGRVVGGDIENSYPVGFRKSENNIGVAELILSPTNDIYRLNVKKQKEGTTVAYKNNPDRIEVVSDTTSINSESWRTGGATEAECKSIVIHTDPETGEFSAMVPPLSYNIGSIKVVKTGKEIGEPSYIDLTNTLITYTDSLENEQGWKYYTYSQKLCHAYHNEPSFTVTQVGHNDGAFGIDKCEVTDAEGTITVDDIYSVDNANGEVTYKYFDAAIFIQDDSYAFEMKGFEEYVNYDGDQPVSSLVPLKDVLVTINNALSASQKVYIEGNEDGAAPGSVYQMSSNQLRLDSLGYAYYKWKAGFPNIVKPYWRTISIDYEVGGRTYHWNGGPLNGIILGALPTGNNFVTAGPDLLDMILRDPPGTGSKAEWSTGTVVSEAHSRGGVWSSETHVQTTSKLGVSTQIVKGIGVAEVSDLQTVFDLKVGTQVNCEGEDASTWSRSVTTTRAISTSEDPDFVGADGDVFIGSSTNIIFGLARNVGFVRADDADGVDLTLHDVVTTGLDFETEFAYTQSYIENTLIPNLELMRNSKLETVSSTEGHKNTGKRPIYLTTLSPDDEKYGSSNHDKEVWGSRATKTPSGDGPSYKMIIPDGSKENYQDSVEWCNNQIKIWQGHLAFNEREKAQAYDLRDSKDFNATNNSFDGGASITYSIETQTGKGSTYECTVTDIVTLGFESGCAINKNGVMWDVATETGGGEHFQDQVDTTKVVSYSYTLAEEGIDALTVDVYEYGKYGPIFRTRGGQTSNPYEGKVVTKYYQPGTTIMEATMQIEVPDIDVVENTVSDIPVGAAANYTLQLKNQSEIGADVAYQLFVLDETNPYGAELSIDGKVLTDGRLIKVPGNQMLTKTLQLRQTNPSILNYDGIDDDLHKDNELYKRGIGIVFASSSQPEDIADTIFIKAYFVPSSSPVELALSKTTINTNTNTDLNLTFSGFDRNFHNLKAFRLQYKKQGSTDWTLLKEYVLNETDVTQSNELLPRSGANVSYQQDIGDFTDGNYLFRCVSASTYGSGEVYRYSDEIALVKDMQRPRPLGLPEPTDGVLDIGDELSVTFNEPFLRGQLTPLKNFFITGVLNGAAVSHETAFSTIGGNQQSPSAKTEAGINLSGKDFSFDAWVHINGAGTLLSHGQGVNKMTVGTNGNGKLVVTIGDKTFTSAKSVPTDKWVFLTLNMKAEGKLNAYVADEKGETLLFNEEATDAYEGNGPLSIGCGINAAIHELLLWDEAHDMTVALNNRSKTKSPSTRHLIGYWKMDEGEGTSIRDYARNRHMTMPKETWYINNENKAVSIDGNNYVSINTSMLPITTADDYAVELWMRGGEQPGDAQLLQMGEVALWLTSDGVLQLTGKNALSPAESTAIATSSGKLTDDVWHHVALNVLRQGAAAVYVDGKRVLTTHAANVGSINSSNMLLGARRSVTTVTTTSPDDPSVTYTSETHQYDRPFKGEVDEVRVWSATMNGDLLAKNRKIRFTGSEPGLVAYYPFETKELDGNNQVVSIPTDEDLCGSGLTAQLVSPNSQTSKLIFVDEAPTLRTKPTETNVSFSYVASDTKIVIEIDEDPATIDGCTLNFNVHDIPDENGNYSENTFWTAFVNQNELEWSEDVLSLEKEVKAEESITATIINKGGQQQMWTLSGLPSWLTASTEYGTTNPRSETEITFTVSESTPIGKYEETVYLKGNNGIETPLTLNITVTGAVPDWSVNPKDFEFSMNVIGRVEIKNIPMDDEDDIVAAFIGEECRGVAHPIYMERYDGSFITMDIYGNDEAGEEVTFRAYDASTGTLYPVVTPDRDTTFVPLALVGKYDNPVVFTVEDLIEQQTELKKGWNWLSLYVVTDNMTVPGVFEKIADNVLNVKSQSDGWLTNEEGSWGGNLGKLYNEQMYAVQLDADRTLRIVGKPVDPNKTSITVGNGWNWIGYYGRQVSSVSNALAGLQPEDSDILKGQSGVTYFDDYEWAGTLNMMEPGAGYMLKSITDDDRQFSYPTSAFSGPSLVMKRAKAAQAAEECIAFKPVNFRNYANNAIMAAKVVAGDRALGHVELGVFADEECRTASVTNDEGIAFLTIPGDDEATLTFKVAIGNQIVDAETTVNFEVDGVYGSPKHPLIIDLSELTGIWEILGDSRNASVYDLQGRKIRLDDNSQRLSKGVYIINGQKKTVK